MLSIQDNLLQIYNFLKPYTLKEVNNSVIEKEQTVSSLEFDSREIQPNSLFVALKGDKTDGHLFIEKAIEKGATVIIHQDKLESYHEKTLYLQVENSRHILSLLSDYYYNSPSRHIPVIGVTGTDGKTSTAFLLYQLFNLVGYKAGLISTFAIDTNERGLIDNPNHQTTPESLTIQKSLFEMINSKKNVVILESSSHGLSDKTNRLQDIQFEVGIFTNLSPEHLEFHGTLEQYAKDKSNLFKKVKNFSVIYEDDPYASLMREQNPKISYTFSKKNRESFLFFDNIQTSLKGSSFDILIEGKKYQARIPILGEFYINNVIATLLTVKQLTLKETSFLINFLPQLYPPKGRVMPIDEGQPYTAIIDYAHTPGSFENLLPMIKDLSSHKVIILFGSAGDRDTQKRAIQGSLADKYADIIILTDEDPRTEEPLAILEEIAEGINRKEREENLWLIPNREEAINFACQIAEEGDTLLFLGKGHENSIIYSDKEIYWNEEEIVRKAIKLSQERDT